MNIDKISFYKSENSDDDFFQYRKYRALQAAKRVQKLRNLSNLNILDIGCGYGPLLAVLSEMGARPTGIDINEKAIKFAKKAVGRRKGVTIFKENSENLSFHDNIFDIVFLFDVIEHVNNPYLALEQSKRVLKPEGILYVEFSPYYNIVGHHLYNFILPIHILPKKFVKWIVYKTIKNKYTADDYWDTFQSLNKIKISSVQTLLNKLHKLEEMFLIQHPDIFEVNLPFLNLLGPMKDIFTVSYIGIYLKKS